MDVKVQFVGRRGDLTFVFLCSLLRALQPTQKVSSDRTYDILLFFIKNLNMSSFRISSQKVLILT